MIPPVDHHEKAPEVAQRASQKAEMNALVCELDALRPIRYAVERRHREIRKRINELQTMLRESEG